MGDPSTAHHHDREVVVVGSGGCPHLAFQGALGVSNPDIRIRNPKRTLERQMGAPSTAHHHDLAVVVVGSGGVPHFEFQGAVGVANPDVGTPVGVAGYASTRFNDLN